MTRDHRLALLAVAHLLLVLSFPATVLLGLADLSSLNALAGSSMLLRGILIFVYIRCVIAWPISKHHRDLAGGKLGPLLLAFVQCSVALALLYYFLGEFYSPWQVLGIAWFGVAAIFLGLATYRLSGSADFLAASIAISVFVQTQVFGDAIGPFRTHWTYAPVDLIYYKLWPIISACLVGLAYVLIRSMRPPSRRCIPAFCADQPLCAILIPCLVAIGAVLVLLLSDNGSGALAQVAVFGTALIASVPCSLAMMRQVG